MSSTPTPSPTVFATVGSQEELESLGGEWDVLVRGMSRPSPFMLHGWVAEWWRHFGTGAQLAVGTARREGRLVGAAPFFTRRSGGLRVARFLGAHESALGDLLIAEGEDESTALGLVDELRRQRFDYADLFGMPNHAALTRAAASKLPLVERVEAPVLLMPDGWEAAYSAKTSSKKRNLHRRRLRQLSEVGDVEFVVGRTRSELEPLLEEALDLHELRWRGRPDGSTFGTETGRVFHRAALRRLADDGVLEIVMMRVGGRPAAFHYFFALEGTMFVHRLAFDPALARYSPGLVATLETLRTASEDGLTRVEFLGGDERYKLELADHLEPLYQGVGLGGSPLGSMAAAQRLGLIRLRKTLKRSERLQRLYLNGFGALKPRRKRASGETDSTPND